MSFSFFPSTGLLAKHYKLQAQSTLLPPDIALASASAAESYRTLRRKQDVELSMQSSTRMQGHVSQGSITRATLNATVSLLTTYSPFMYPYHSAKAGVAHQRRGRFKEALACYARALQLKADNVETLVARGALYTKLCVQSYNDGGNHRKTLHMHWPSTSLINCSQLPEHVSRVLGLLYHLPLCVQSFVCGLQGRLCCR